MKRYLIFLAFLVFFGFPELVGAVDGQPFKEEDLNVTASVTLITSTTYRPAAGSPELPVLIQTKGAGYYRLDPYEAVSSTNFTPAANAGYTCADGDIIEVEHPQWFRIIRSVASFSACVTSFSR